MKRRVGFTVSFTDPDGATRSETGELEPSYPPEPAHERRISNILLAELLVAAGPQTPPKHNTTAQRWIDFSRGPADFTDYLNIHNSQALWFELTNLVMGVQADLALAQSYKNIEPEKEPAFDDDVGLNQLFYIHLRKMSLLNQAVHDLIKVQDLVNRLLHESLGGDLVDTTDPDWERTQLTRKKVRKGLESKRSSGMLVAGDFQAITEALEIPTRAANADIALAYRNRLAHHIRPTVDYPTFFSFLESRKSAETRDAQGKLVGLSITIRSRPPVEYRFQELHAAFCEYLDALVDMLDQLSRVKILRR